MHRGGIELRKQGLLALQRIGFFRIAMKTQAAALEQPDDAPGNTSRHPRNFRVVRRR